MEFKPCEICYSGHITFDEVYDVFTATEVQVQVQVQDLPDFDA